MVSSPSVSVPRLPDVQFLSKPETKPASLTKTLSVVVPNCNDAPYLEAQLKEICRQSFQPCEIIVVDDGSSDNSVEIIQRLAKKYPTIRLLSNDKNRGVIYSINRGAELARGDYIYFASANDLVLPGLFEKSMSL